MPIHRLLACSALAAAVAACDAAPQPEAATPRRAPTAAAQLRFVGPPAIVLNRDFGYIDVWVRLNRQLRHTVGTPGDHAGREAHIELADTDQDVPGLLGYALLPTCYSQSLAAGASFDQLSAGAPLEVSLVLDATHRVTATAALQIADEDTTPRPDKQLACPSRAPGKPRPQRCNGRIVVPDLGLGAVSAAGTSCRRARQVLRAVGRHASGRCYRDLCVSKHPKNLGYRCSAGLSGEAAWDVVCRRGHAEIRGFAAE